MRTPPYFSCVLTPSVLGTSLHFLNNFDAPAGVKQEGGKTQGFFLSLSLSPPFLLRCLGFTCACPLVLCLLANMRFPLINRTFLPRRVSMWQRWPEGSPGCQLNYRGDRLVLSFIKDVCSLLAVSSTHRTLLPSVCHLALLGQVPKHARGRSLTWYRDLVSRHEMCVLLEVGWPMPALGHALQTADICRRQPALNETIAINSCPAAAKYMSCPNIAFGSG